MERLTLVPNDGRDAGLRGYYSEQDAINRLAAYEDTGLEPEEVAYFLGTTMSVKEAKTQYAEHKKRYDEWFAWKQAEEEGRLLVLPCRIGDPVWFVVQDVDDPGRWEICESQKVTEAGTRGFWTSALLNDAKSMDLFTPWSALGSEAFLSREAAKAALEERENDG